MRIQKNKDYDAFMKVIDSCKGKVELVTGEGDRLNLKSKLSQYVSLPKLFSEEVITELEIIAYETEDSVKLVNYLMNEKAEQLLRLDFLIFMNLSVKSVLGQILESPAQKKRRRTRIL